MTDVVTVRYIAAIVSVGVAIVTFILQFNDYIRARLKFPQVLSGVTGK